MSFKDNHDLLPDNYSICLKCLKGLQKWFSKDDKLLQNYHQIGKDQLDSSVIEPVPNSEIKSITYLIVRLFVTISQQPRFVWCLTRVLSRMVSHILVRRWPKDYLAYYYASAYTSSCLPLILKRRSCRFYLNKDFVRFLWYQDRPNLNNANIESIVQVYRLCRVLFGVNSSPFLLSATLIEYFKQLPNEDFFEKVLKYM